MNGAPVTRPSAIAVRGDRSFARLALRAGSGFALQLACLLGGGSTAAWAAPPDAPRIHVRGNARIDAHVARAQGKFVISGRVTDDSSPGTSGAPGAGGNGARPRSMVSLGVAPGPVAGASAQGPQAGLATALASSAPEPCEGGGRPVLDSPEKLLLPADAAGFFCVQLTLAIGKYVAHMEVPAAGLLDGAQLDLPFDLSLGTVALAFAPARPFISLDSDTTTVDAMATAGDAATLDGAHGARGASAGLRLALSNESGSALGESTTDATGAAHFAVTTASLGAPGRGELRLSFAGNASASATSASTNVERRTSVDLKIPAATSGALPEAAVDDPVEVFVVASAACAPRGCHAVPTGTVQATLVDAGTESVVGASPVERGTARLVLRLPPTLVASTRAPARVALKLRYVPDAPWFEAPAEVDVLLPVRPPGPWGEIGFVVAGLGVLLCLGVARFPRRPPAGEAGEPARATLDAREGIALVRPGVAGRWKGNVVDAHVGTGIRDARVAIERAAFRDRDTKVVAQVVTDGSGAFELVATDTPVQVGDELVVESRVHGRVRRPLPPAGEIEVAMVQRRRILLDRLVAWARRRGRPFDGRPEPTPAHVQRAAGRLEFALEQRAQAAQIERWAGAVEQAAFAGVPIDERAQAAVDELAPADASRTDDARGEAPAADKKRA